VTTVLELPAPALLEPELLADPELPHPATTIADANVVTKTKHFLDNKFLSSFARPSLLSRLPDV
jgi:hypothetical protein